jgi:hypothetical protein
MNFFLLISLILLNIEYVKCQSISLQQKPVCIDNFKNINGLDSIFKNNNIILLGEAGHGDGETFELKTKLIKYLYEKHGYTILINEASGLTETIVQNSQKINPSTIFKNTGDEKFSNSQQYAKLYRFLKRTPRFKYYGLDCQPVNLDILLNELRQLGAKMKDKYLANYLNDMSLFFEQAVGRREFTFSLDSLNVLDSLSIQYYKNVSAFNHSDPTYIEILLQNFRANLRIAIHNIEEMSYSYKSINWRDSVMALNVDYIMNMFPNEKVIISAANFHNARNMHQLYRNEDSTYYAKIKPCGWYIANKYKEKAYSIAIASTSGTFGYCTDTSVFTITEVAKYKIDNNVLETNLLISDCEISFYDFRKDDNLRTQTYRSLIFGTNMHKGKWSMAFDGVINIKNQKHSTPMKK